ncbi:amidohydrolase family protein, partial [Metarhizium robertsii]
CWEVLQRGYTSVRDLAGHGCEVSRAVDEGAVAGPNIYAAGACISQLAGHGDVFALPAGDVLLNLGAAHVRPGHYASAPSCIAAGEDECRQAVRLQVRRGARCVKVLASGGVMSGGDDPTHAQFSPRELAAVVDEARRLGRSVAAHVHGKPGIVAAVEAGVRTVEHASLADDECLALIKRRGVVYVATREAIELLLELGDDLPRVHRDKLRLLEWAVEAGLSNLEAIRAATANGPLTVEGQAPRTGQLKAGYEADFIGVTANPVADVRVLQNEENIRWVWKGGRLFKGPGVGPWGEPAWF